MHILHDHLSLHTYILCPISLSKILAALSVHANNPDIRLNCLNETLFFPFFCCTSNLTSPLFFFFFYSFSRSKIVLLLLAECRPIVLWHFVETYQFTWILGRDLHSYNRRRYYERNFKEPRACLRNDSPSKSKRKSSYFFTIYLDGLVKSFHRFSPMDVEKFLK